MSPQGRKRVAGMVSRDYQTVSGIGGGSQTYQQVSKLLGFKKSLKLNLKSNF